jgi:hypothetical protein
LFRTTIDGGRAALRGNRPQRSQDAAGADQEAGSGAEDRQTQNRTHHPKFVRLLGRVGRIWCPEPEVRCIVSGLDRRMVFHCVRDTVHRPFQTVTISECRYRWLRLGDLNLLRDHWWLRWIARAALSQRGLASYALR